MAVWYVKRNESIFGPITWEALQQAARSGKVRPSDPVRRDDDTFWKPASEARNDPAPVPQPHVRSIAEAAAMAQRTDAGTASPEPAPAIAPVITERAENLTPQLVTTAAPPSATDDSSAAVEPFADVPDEASHNKAGSVLLALLIGIVGLFGFGMLCGGLAVAIAGSSLRSARGVTRFLAMCVIVLGMVEVGLTAVAITQTGVSLPFLR